MPSFLNLLASRLTWSLSLTLFLTLSKGLPLGAAEEPVDPLSQLPIPAVTQAQPVPARGELTAIAPGISATADTVILEGVTLVDSGPADGLEVIACLDGGKAHESLIRLTTSNGQLVKFAVIRVLGSDDGVSSPESSGIPAVGTPVRMCLEWPVGDPQGPWQQVDVSCLVRDRVIDSAYPAVPFIYTGSRIVSMLANGRDGQPQKVDRFMLDVTKSVAVIFDEADALFASPFLNADTDSRYEANSALAARPNTPCRLTIAAAVLPLTVDLRAGGQLGHAGAVVDDAAVVALLQQHYPAAYTGLRAVAVQVSVPAAGEALIQARAHLLRLAVQAGVWVIPVFVPALAP